jgi:hypothetical protein
MPAPRAGGVTTRTLHALQAPSPNLSGASARLVRDQRT